VNWNTWGKPNKKSPAPFAEGLKALFKPGVRTNLATTFLDWKTPVFINIKMATGMTHYFSMKFSTCPQILHFWLDRRQKTWKNDDNDGKVHKPSVLKSCPVHANMKTSL